jgi:hypothetical protein
LSAVQTRFLEGADNTYKIVRSQDVAPIADYAKGMQAAGMTGSKDMKHAAEIPMLVVENYMTRMGITFEEFCSEQKHGKALLNDPALAAFRIWEGRV